MGTVLSITIPFFAIIFLGTAFSVKKIFNSENAKILTKFALYVTLPPFMFINILKASTNSGIFNWDFIIRFEIISLLLLSLSFLISFLTLNNNKKKSSLFALNSTYPNYGYMGIPLSILAFGEIASIPISLILLIDTLVLLIFTSFFATHSKKNNLINEFFLVFIQMFKNPILLAVSLGFIFVIFDIKIYSVIYNFLEILSYAATPTALFAIGINLYNRIENNAIKQISIITIFKLIVHPFLLFSIFYFFPTNNVPDVWVKVAILCSCLPVAGNVFAMSIYYDSFVKITSSSILVTTVLSTFTVPIVLFLLL
jgi:predicted permease